MTWALAELRRLADTDVGELRAAAELLLRRTPEEALIAALADDATRRAIDDLDSAVVVIGVDGPRLALDGDEPDREALGRLTARWRRVADRLAGQPFEELWACLFDPWDAVMLGERGVRELSTALVVRGLADELDFGAARLVLAGMRGIAPPAAVTAREEELRDGEDRAVLTALLVALAADSRRDRS